MRGRKREGRDEEKEGGVRERRRGVGGGVLSVPMFLMLTLSAPNSLVFILSAPFALPL